MKISPYISTLNFIPYCFKAAIQFLNYKFLIQNVVGLDKITVAKNLNWWALYFGKHFISPSFFAHLCPTLFYSYRKQNLIFSGQEGGEFEKKNFDGKPPVWQETPRKVSALSGIGNIAYQFPDRRQYRSEQRLCAWLALSR